MNLFTQALQIEKGVTALIGGGGKTTLLYRLARELSHVGSVIVTTSTHIWKPEHIPFSPWLGRVHGVACTGTETVSGKLAAPAQSFEELAGLADYVLVEADGSAGRPLKAHAAHEPVIPSNASQTILVVGASGLNRPIGDAAHRPEIYRALAGEEITAAPRAEARVIEKEKLHTRVLINQCDSPARTEAARELGALLSCPVVLASLQKGEIVCLY